MEKEKYENIYYKVHPDKMLMGRNCFICKEVIKNNNVFEEKSLWMYDQQGNDKYLPIIYVCFDCIKTPKKAETVIIPLLKIIYGYKLLVMRVNKKTGNRKEFWY